MKYIAQYNKRVNKYFARSVSSGKTVSTDRLMEEIANASTVAPADVAATLRALCDARPDARPGRRMNLINSPSPAGRNLGNLIN